MSSSSEFQAVDLDAVLDEFESSQNLVEENTTMGKEDHKSENVIKPHLLENLNALPESPPTKTINDELDEPEYANYEHPTDNLSMNNSPNERIDQICVDVSNACSQEIKSVNPQPDVLSGLDNISQNLVEDDQNDENSETSKSSSEFESLYDKYKDKSDEEINEVESDETPVAAAVPFQPADVSNEELNDMLEDLDVEEEENGAIASAPMEQLGARPKEFSSASNEVPDLVMDTDDAKEISTNEEPSFDHETDLPRESPPPYSEVDPLKKSIERPNSLDLSSETPAQESLASPQENAQINDETTNEVGPPGSTPANPNGPTEAGIPESLQGLNEDQLMIGKVAPFWIPDSEAANCMICDAKFTMIRRKHHCRGCGHVLCSICCSDKFPLSYMDFKEGRVCKPCKNILERLAKAEGSNSTDNQRTSRPNPANPMEYCSTIPPHQQVTAEGATATPPSVMVPVGVLKRPDVSSSGESRPHSDPKSHDETSVDCMTTVMFSDGIRPGGDLTELDGSPENRRPSRRSGLRGHKKNRSRHKGPIAASDVAKSLIPNEGLPYVSGQGHVESKDLVLKFLMQESVPFTLNRNLRVYVKLLHYSPVSEFVWNFRTQGMTAVGQDEIVILLVKSREEDVPPRDVFEHLQTLYEQAGRGGQVSDMGYSVILSGSTFLGSQDFGGFLYFRHTFQCLDGLDLPQSPFLFGVLITRWEMPWARVFPLRLLLRLGAESRYYPTPLWSWRDRTSVYKEIGQTIMQVLCDFRNFTYSVPIIKGMVIHMEDKLTTVLIPKNSYSQIQKALQISNTPVLALGANFSPTADSHLVAVQRDDDEPSKNPMNNSDYETQAINIQNKERKVTGASFLVLSGALKKSSGLTAKSSIVDDGIMVQIGQDRMMSIRKNINNMENIKIDCGPLGSENPDETVQIKWVDAPTSVNAGIKSLIDGSALDGVVSIRMSAGGTDFASGNNLVRWTEVFLLPSKNPERPGMDVEDPARAAGHLARAICMALMPHLAKLKEADLTPLAVRVNLDPDSACYEAGSHGQALPPEFMNTLDNELIPIIHGQASTHAAFEFVFHILDL